LIFYSAFLSYEILGVAYMLIYRNAEGVHGQIKAGNLCARLQHALQ